MLGYTYNKPMKGNCKVWLEKDGKDIFGGGRIKLLLAIDRLGSLKKAAEELGYSYRFAWGKIKDMEKRLGNPLVVSHKGGYHGGDTVLTDYARNLLNRFIKYEEEMKRINDTVFRRYFDDKLS